MRLFVGVTDDEWYHFLAARPQIADLNFWRPSGQGFSALSEGELFLFKLHSPLNFIVGGGFYTRTVRLPLSLAWEAFAEGNGASTREAMAQRIAKYRKEPYDARANPEITCIILSEPFYFPREQWLPIPESFRLNVVVGKGYDTREAEGQALYDAVAMRLSALSSADPLEAPAKSAVVTSARYGAPRVIRPRLGQGAFRAIVTDAYERRCAVTGEKTLPVLEAAHVQPYSAGGPHEVANGLLLRSDLHRLYDLGYLTVEPDERRLLVSRRIRDEFDNGRHYYELEGTVIRPPRAGFEAVGAERLRYHAEQVFRG